MKSQGYIRGHQNAIKRELKVILKEHLSSSVFLLLFAFFLIFLSAQFEPPSEWDEATIELSSVETVRLVRGGTRLDIYDENGCRYTINRNEEAIMQQLVVGRKYSFMFSDNYYHDIIEDIRIDGVKYIDFDDSVKNYYGYKILLGVFIAAFIGLLMYLNITVYKAETKKRVKRIKEHKRKIYNTRD